MGRCPASEVNDGPSPEKPDHLSLEQGGLGSFFNLWAEAGSG
jgi:hypothetical protein